MAGSTGVTEAGKAWITISVEDKAGEALHKISEDLKSFAETSNQSVGVFDKNLSQMSANAAKSWGDIASTVTNAGDVLTAGFKSAYAPMKEAVGIFSNFDDQMRFAASKIAGSSAQDIEMLTDKAKLLGRTMSFTATNVAQGMTQLAQGGFNAQQIDAAIKPVMDLARGTGTDIATTADIVINMLRSFNLSAEDTTRVCDVLVTTANSSAQNLIDIGYAAKMSGTNMKQAGASLEDYMKMLGTLANFGTRGTSGGTSLRKILTQSVAPGKVPEWTKLGIKLTDYNATDEEAAGVGAEALGVKQMTMEDFNQLDEETKDYLRLYASNFHGNLMAMTDILAQATEKTKGMGSAERSQWMYRLAGATGMTGAQNLMPGIDETVSRNIDNSAGAAATTAQKMDAGLGGSTRMMKSAVEGLQIALGDSLAPVLTQCSDAINQIATFTGNWVARNKEIVAGVAQVGAAVSAVGAVLLGTGVTITAVQKAATLWGPTMTAFSKSTQIAATATSVLGKAFLFLEANPIVALFTVLAAAVGAVAVKLYLASRESKNYAHSAAEIQKQHEQDAASDNAKMERLAKLASQQSLTNKEFGEAQEIILELSGRYKDLGISVDGTTKSIKGVTEAQKKMLDIQQRQAEHDMRAKESEAKKNKEKALADVKKHTAFNGQEFTVTELEKLNEKFNNTRGADTDWVKNRAVMNPATGKYMVVQDQSYMAGAWAFDEKKGIAASKEKLQKTLEELEQADIDLGAVDTERKMREESQKAETEEKEETEPAEDTVNNAAETAAETAVSAVTSGAGAPIGTEPLDTTPIPSDLLEAVPSPSGNADGENIASIAAQQSAGLQALTDELATMKLDDESGNLNASIDEATASLNALKEQRENQAAEAMTAAAQAQDAANKAVRGPGSAGDRLKMSEKLAMETAENTRVTADFVKKIYDLMNGRESAAAFAQ